GLATGLILTVHARQAGRTYAASLAGAGVGGLVGLALIASVTPPRLAAAVALLAIAGAGCLWHGLPRIGKLGTLAGGLIVLAFCWFPGSLRLSQFKPLSRTLDLPEARVIASKSGVHGWVQVVAAPALRPSPAVSLQ